MITEETSNVDWARVLLDQSTDDIIINVSREKIAHELIKPGVIQVTPQGSYQYDRQQTSTS
jgi:hypothetical protein